MKDTLRSLSWALLIVLIGAVANAASGTTSPAAMKTASPPHTQSVWPAPSGTLSQSPRGKIINQNPLTASAHFGSENVQAGREAQLIIKMQLADQHHAYLDMFHLRVTQPENISVHDFDVSPVTRFNDKFSKKVRTAISAGESTMLAPVNIPQSLAAGTYTAQLLLTYQACTADYCLLPKQIPLTAKFTVVNSSSGAGSYLSEPHFLSRQNLQHALHGHWWVAFLLVFLGGLLTSFTPCIFPMIPITLAVLGTRTPHVSRRRAFLLSLSYVLGIAFTYSLLGLFAATSGALFGSLLGNPIAVTVIALLFVLLALSLFGLFEIQVPAAVANRLGTTKTEGGFVGAFVTGLLAGVVASPCVGPILVGILAFVAESQSTVFGFALLFTYAMGMGLIFLVLGTFSQLLSKLPKSGSWMLVVKFLFGVAMLALAFYYLQPVTPPRLWRGLIGITLILLASFYGAFQSNQELKSPWLKWRKGLMITLFVFGLLVSMMALLPSLTKILSPNELPATSVQNSKVPWQKYSPQALAEAKKNGRDVIIDFYADWCVACHELEQKTFNDAKVLAATHNFVWLRFDATRSSPEFEKLKKRYEIQGLPHVVFIDHTGKWARELTLTGFESPVDFLKRLAALK